jgi:hypothetical protein
MHRFKKKKKSHLERTKQTRELQQTSKRKYDLKEKWSCIIKVQKNTTANPILNT